MKYNKKEMFSDSHRMLAHVLMLCIPEENGTNNEVVNSIADNDEIEVEFKINGFELNIFKFAERLDEQVDNLVRNKASLMITEQKDKIIKEVHQSVSKEAKLQKIKEQMDKMINTMKMLQLSIDLIK